MKQGTVDLLNSERGVIFILLVVASTTLVILGKLAVSDWLTYTQWLAMALVASKTVTSSISLLKGSPVPTATVVQPGNAADPAAGSASPSPASPS